MNQSAQLAVRVVKSKLKTWGLRCFRNAINVKNEQVEEGGKFQIVGAERLMGSNMQIGSVWAGTYLINKVTVT